MSKDCYLPRKAQYTVVTTVAMARYNSNIQTEWRSVKQVDPGLLQNQRPATAIHGDDK
jgi:hypothetical protein